MIEDRRKKQAKDSKRTPKKASTADRSIATGKAKRAAAMKAKRGLTPTKAPTAMEIEREVYRQSRKTDNAKKKKENKATGGRIAPDSTARNKKKKEKKATGKVDPPAAIFGGRAPPKKAIEAAIKGMEGAGFKIPKGHQMMMTFVPTAVAPAPAPTKGANAKGKKATPAKATPGKNTPAKGNKGNQKGAGGRKKK